MLSQMVTPAMTTASAIIPSADKLIDEPNRDRVYQRQDTQTKHQRWHVDGIVLGRRRSAPRNCLGIGSHDLLSCDGCFNLRLSIVQRFLWSLRLVADQFHCISPSLPHRVHFGNVGHGIASRASFHERN